MAAPKCLTKYSVLLRKREEELYEIIEAAMSLAARRNPKAFAARKNVIARNLFSLPEDVIGSVYEKSHTTAECSSDVSDVTKHASKVVADDLRMKNAKLRLKPHLVTTTKQKTIGASRVVTSSNFEAAKTVQHNFGVSKLSTPGSVKDTDSRLDKKFEASIRKFQQNSQHMAEATRKTKLLDVSEMKDLLKPTRDVKRPKFRH